MKVNLQILLLYCIFPAFAFGQFSDNFSDGDITNNPTWIGDLEKFKVNEINELQLNDIEAGESSIYTPYNISVDFTWKAEILMNFAPSSNNKLQIFFLADNPDVEVTNGYMLEIGENLANDALNIFKVNAGSTSLIASGELGALASKPASIAFQIDRVEGNWTIYTDYNGIGTLAEEISFFDDEFDFITEANFIIQTKYTSSNTDQFYFDNLSADIFQPDITGPEFTQSEIFPPNILLLGFNESILESSLNNFTYTTTPDLTLSQISNNGSVNQNVILEFNEDFQSGINYTIDFSGLTDNDGNAINMTSSSFQLFEKAIPGDLVINEILFNPLTTGEDFIEVKNISKKFLNLKGLIFLNNTKTGTESPIDIKIILEPNEVLAFTTDWPAQKLIYEPIENANFMVMSIPTLNAGDGNLTILSETLDTIDTYTYSEDDHFSLLDEVKGVSLERIFPESASVSTNFASGVESTNFATPGYENANFRQMGSNMQDVLVIDNSIFSPNADGDEDQLIMVLNMPGTGYVSTINIFNVGGQLIKTLHTNRLTGENDLASWDGTMNDGGKAPIGHYIVLMEAFNQLGNTVSAKKHIKLLDFF